MLDPLVNRGYRCGPCYSTSQRKWKWAGHVSRRTDGRWVGKLLEWRPKTGRNSVGGQPAIWADDIIKIVGKHWMKRLNADQNGVQRRITTSSIG